MLNDGKEAVGHDGGVYLNTQCIFRLSLETCDLEMLFDPLNKQFYLPSMFVKDGNFFCLEIEVFCVVNKTSVQLWHIINDESDNTRIFCPILLFSKADALVFEHVVHPFKNVFPINDFKIRISFFSDDKKGSESMNPVETCKIKVPSIKNIVSQRFLCVPIYRVDVKHFGIGDFVEYGDLCKYISLRMDSDARFRASELCPSEHSHTEVDGHGVDGIESTMRFELLRDSFGLSLGYHVKGKLLKYPVVSERIRLGQHLPIDGLATKAEMLGFSTMVNCKICEFPEASASHEMAEHQHKHVVLVRHRKIFCSVVGEDSPELPLGEKLCYLCKNILSNMHIHSDLKSYAKIRISKPGQGVGELKRYA